MNELRIWPSGRKVESAAQRRFFFLELRVPGRRRDPGIASGAESEAVEPACTGIAAFASTAMPPSN